jgi:hypothetical protein
MPMPMPMPMTIMNGNPYWLHKVSFLIPPALLALPVVTLLAVLVKIA